MSPVRCCEPRCTRLVGPNAIGASYEVTGWVVLRKGQGMSANSVHEKTFTGRVRCPDCTKKLRLGLSPEQQGLDL